MMNTSDNHALGDFLRARRQRLDPATFGSPGGTPAHARSAPRRGRAARQ
ncbi:hypothetical protein LRM35_00680 [Klebsiella variicola subsp. variicola]|nr:hypothetical protein LRM35_00680 [Klebsiella variicola subsp. variicola]